ncbi:MAG: hypothetical protein GF331_16865 [Chitinivibrionales bacterium]|nr:hypothetical protein [Chitinivibrionales bacterium]
MLVLKGNDGKEGTQVLAGAGSPASDSGRLGDFYIDTAAMDFYGPKSSSGWGSATALVGADSSAGNTILVGSTAPDSAVGNDGDLFLDTMTYTLYGPKASGHWGTGAGLQGADGQDGEDGSQIFAGDGAPAGSLGTVGDYYLDRANYDLYGPKFTVLNSDVAIWGVPINLKGSDGNANVTRYLFPGNDFAQNSAPGYMIDMASEEEMNSYVWFVYLRDGGVVYQVPGYPVDLDNYYRVSRYYDSADSQVVIIIWTELGVGHYFSAVEIVRIGISTFVDSTAYVQAPEQTDAVKMDYETATDLFGF